MMIHEKSKTIELHVSCGKQIQKWGGRHAPSESGKLTAIVKGKNTRIIKNTHYKELQCKAIQTIFNPRKKVNKLTNCLVKFAN